MVNNYGNLGLQRSGKIHINININDSLLNSMKVVIDKSILQYIDSIDSLLLIHNDGFIELDNELLQKYFNEENKLIIAKTNVFSYN